MPAERDVLRRFLGCRPNERRHNCKRSRSTYRRASGTFSLLCCLVFSASNTPNTSAFSTRGTCGIDTGTGPRTVCLHRRTPFTARCALPKRHNEESSIKEVKFPLPSLQIRHVISTFLVSLSLCVTVFGFAPANADTASANQQMIIVADASASSSEQPADNDDGDDGPPPIPSHKSRYYTIMRSGTRDDIIKANEALMDHAVGIISSLYYDKTAGAYFTPRDLYDKWRALRAYGKEGDTGLARLREQDAERGENRLAWMKGDKISPLPEDGLGSRENVVKSLKWIVSTLDDPYSSYMTREELWDEVHSRSDGFLGTGAIVEIPKRISPTTSWFHTSGEDPQIDSSLLKKNPSILGHKNKAKSDLLSRTRADNLPKVTAIIAHSPAERAGITVGDRIVAVGSDKFVGNRERVEQKLKSRYASKNYIGYPEIIIAKPVMRPLVDANGYATGREQVACYRKTRVSLPTSLVEPFQPYSRQFLSAVSDPTGYRPVAGGNNIVNYQLITRSESLFQRMSSGDDATTETGKVGYIRMTRFSKAATEGFYEAISELEAAGATSYVIDLRNCYGGVIQDAFVTASSLLRDPKTVLCYTIDARGGFTPHIVEDFVTDSRYRGYLLSREPLTTTIDQVKKSHSNSELEQDQSIPKDSILWVPSTSYASLREQSVKKGFHTSTASLSTDFDPPYTYKGYDSLESLGLVHFHRSKSKAEQIEAQKPIVILVNEGTASSAEMFAAALKDNGRATAIVGRRTFGKGLVQHAIPLPDGGALKLTIAEYLTPGLKHVTNIGKARYDQTTGELVGGGLKPDTFCPSNIGIPSNVGADICIGIALDEIQEVTEPVSL